MLSVIPITEADRWDSIVQSFQRCDVYYLSSYTKAFMIHGDGEPVLFFYEDLDIRAMNVVMKRDIEKDQNFTGKIQPNTLFDIITPYGYGGFLIEGSITENSLSSLDREYSSYCKNNGIISEFVRFHPVLNNVEAVSGIYDISVLGKTITMDLSSHEHIWNNLLRQNRNRIRKAQKNGVKIYWGLNPGLLENFMPLYNKTMDKDNAKAYYYFNKDFYDSFLDDIKYHTLLFYSVYEDKIIAMSIILFTNHQLHYHLSASNMEYQQLAPTNLLLYEAACWGLKNGYKTLHLGGGVGCREDSLYIYKKTFNKNSNTYFSIGRKIFDKDQYRELIEIRKQDPDFDENISFYPVYRG